MKEQHGKKRVFVTALGKVALVLLGLATALGLPEMLMRTFKHIKETQIL